MLTTGAFGPLVTVNASHLPFIMGLQPMIRADGPQAISPI